uniref:WXG100 family type VII secretion target n=1 Tax=Streptomyces sp. NBC_00008 TaxID=2903610 RepID=A0AAU2VL00_9ACTN
MSNTPAPPGNLQTSSQSENQKGYNALGTVKDGIKQSQEEVRTTMSGLMAAYGGQDGGAYQRLLADWSGQVDIITKNIGQMMEKLQETGVHQRTLQGQTTETIQTSTRSNDVFGQLT